MGNIYFWKSWQNPYRFLITGMLILLLILIVASLILHVIGVEGMIGWSVLSLQSGYRALIEVTDIGPFAFDLVAPKMQVIDFFEGKSIPDAAQFSSIGLAIISCSIIIYLSAISYLKRFWYLMGIASFMIFLIFLHPEYLQVFGWSNKPILILFFGILFVPSYYVHAFLKSENFNLRLLITTASVLVLGIVVFLFSEITHPFTGLFNFGLLAPFLITLIFVVIVSHEIIRIFLKVASTNLATSGKSRLRHFLILTLIYWVNVLLTYLKITHIIEWDIVYLNPFLLLSISTVLGFWGMHQRSILYEGASSIKPLWLLIYLTLGIVSYTFIAYLMLGLNDPFLSVVGDFVIYSHLAIGMAFLLYVIYNFMPVIEKGYNAEQVLYNPSNLPYFTYRLVGLLGIVALVSMRGLNYPVWYSMGGYYNAIADYYKVKNDPDLARVYYIKSSDFAHINHKANYNLGEITLEDNNKEAILHYKKALRGESSPQAYVNIANIQDRDQAYFESLFTLQEGVQEKPKSIQLANNLGVQFEKANLLDSAMYYFDLVGTSSPVVNGNKLAFSQRYGLTIGQDSATLLSSLTLGGKANASDLGYFDFKWDNLDGSYMFDKVILNNWLLSDNPTVMDSSLFKATAVVDSTLNVDYKEELEFALSIAAFRAGAVNQGIMRLQTLISTGQNRAINYVETLGTFYMVLGDFDQAIEPLKEAQEGGSKSAAFKLAISLSELGVIEEATKQWEDLGTKGDDDLVETAQLMIACLNEQDFEPKDDFQKFLFLHFRRLNTDEVELLQVLKTIKDSTTKVKAGLDLANYYYQKEDLRAADIFLQHVEVSDSDSSLAKQKMLLKLKISAQNGSLLPEDHTSFVTNFKFTSREYLESLWLKISVSEQLDSVDFMHLAGDNAFFVEGVLAAAEYFKSDSDPFRSYTIITDALNYNTNSSRLLYQYVIYATNLGLIDYAEGAVLQYGQRFPGQKFNQLLKEFQYLRKEFENFSEPEE